MKLNNQSFLKQSLGNFLQQNVYNMQFTSVDAQVASDISQSMRVRPGNHQIVIDCTWNQMASGRKNFSLNAKAGRTYTISFPSNYTPDEAGCNRLILQ